MRTRRVRWGLPLVLVAGCIASWPVLGQKAAQIAQAEQEKQQAIIDARRGIERRAQERRAEIAAAWSRVASCADIGRFERRYDESGYGSKIGAARQRLCVSPIPDISPTPPSRPTLTGLASPSGHSKVEIVIQGRTIRLAQVMDCNPGSGIDLSELIESYPLICRPAGEDYQCHLRDTGEDVASLAVEKGIAQPRGDDYSNEFYKWRREADLNLPAGGKSRQCSSGR